VRTETRALCDKCHFVIRHRTYWSHHSCDTMAIILCTVERKIYKFFAWCWICSWKATLGLYQMFLTLASIPPGDIKIRCWGYSTVLGSKVRIRTLNQWFSTFFDAFFPWLILELFIPPLLHNFRRVAEKVQTSFSRWLRSHVVGWSIILVALLRPFNKPYFMIISSASWFQTSSRFNCGKVKESLRKLGMHEAGVIDDIIIQ